MDWQQVSIKRSMCNRTGFQNAAGAIHPTNLQAFVVSCSVLAQLLIVVSRTFNTSFSFHACGSGSLHTFFLFPSAPVGHKNILPPDPSFWQPRISTFSFLQCGPVYAPQTCLSPPTPMCPSCSRSSVLPLPLLYSVRSQVSWRTAVRKTNFGLLLEGLVRRGEGAAHSEGLASKMLEASVGRPKRKEGGAKRGEPEKRGDLEHVGSSKKRNWSFRGEGEGVCCP